MVALAHGTNDAQKTMGVITLTLITVGLLPAHSAPPLWVVAAAGLAIAAGTAMGGWRIIQTLGRRISDIESPQGFAAETASTAVILSAAHLGFALSTTQVTTGAVLGAATGRGPGRRALGVVAPDGGRLAADPAGRGDGGRRWPPGSPPAARRAPCWSPPSRSPSPAASTRCPGARRSPPPPSTNCPRPRPVAVAARPRPRSRRDIHMTIHWETLLAVFVVSLGTTVAVVALVTLALLGLSARAHARPGRPAGSARAVHPYGRARPWPRPAWRPPTVIVLFGLWAIVAR